MTTTAVTVVVPTRNRRAVLAVTLGSIAGQRDVAVRVVVVDEASTDDTPAYLAALAGPKLTVVRNDEPTGVAAARNAGIALADTEWVAMCDDDDVWAPDKLAAQLAEVRRVDGARWSCTGTVSISPDLAIVGYHRPPPSGDLFPRMQCNNAVPGGGSSVIAETALVREIGGYDAWPTGCEDYDLGCRFARRSPCACVDRPLVAYRVWPGSMSADITKMSTGHKRVVERYRGAEVDPADARRGDLEAEQYWGRFHLRNRDRAGALRAYLRIAARYRQPGQAAYALWGLVSPTTAERHQARLEREAVPESWRAEVASWLKGVQPLEPVSA